MECPFCGEANTTVSNSRPTKEGGAIWRRRACPHCEQVFSTYETPSLDYLVIKKRSGKTTRYLPHKLFASIYDALASGKRADKGDAAVHAQEVVNLIESKIRHSKKREITTTELVDLVTGELERSNLGACYRYAAFAPHRGMKFGI